MITVIVPVYNAATTLRRCVDSILHQSYRDFELLLIDDGSTDSSPLLCDAYARQDSRVRVFHKPNGGVSSAHNVGLDHARGEWITFCDADDWVEDSFSEVMAARYTEDIVCFSHVVTRPFRHVREFCSTEETYDEQHPFPAEWLHTMFRSPWAELFRMSCVGTLRFDTKIKVGEDFVFNLQFLSRARTLRYVPGKPFYCYDEPATHFLVKYQTSIERSVYAMERIFQAYWKLMIQDRQFEFLLFSDYKKLCQMDIYKRPRVWYDAPGVRMVYDRTKHSFPLRYRVNYFLMSFSWVSRMRVKLKSMEE